MDSLLAIAIIGLDGFDLNGNGAADGWEPVLIWLGAIAATVTAVFIIWKALVRMAKFFHRVTRLLDALLGEDADPKAGRPAIPGGLERLALMEVKQHDMQASIEDVKATTAASINDLKEANDARLGGLEATMLSVKTKVEYELGRNGGNTTKDGVSNALRGVEQIKAIVNRDQDNLVAFKDQYAHDRRQSNRQFARLFDGVAQMIRATPEEQEAIWQECKREFVDDALDEDNGKQKTRRQ